MRPRRDRGDPDTTALKQESVLWQSTMQRVYGEDWRALLEEQQAAEEEDEGADVESVTVGERSAEASVASASAGLAGSATTSQGLRQTLLEESDVGAETAAEHRQRMDMVIDQLESLGDPVSPLERRKVTFRREYCEQIVGQTLQTRRLI